MEFLNGLKNWGPWRAVAENIRYKLLLTLSLLALGPLVVLGFVAYRITADVLRRRILEQYTSVAKARADSLAALQARNIRILQFAAKDNWLHDRLKQAQGDPADEARVLAEISEHLKEVKKSTPNLEAVNLLDDKGQVLARSEGGPAAGGRDHGKDLFFTGAMAIPGKPFVKPINRSPVSGKVEQALSLTVADRSTGEITGVLVFLFNVEAILAVMADYSGLGETGEAYAVNGDGLMASPSRLTREDTVLKKRDASEGIQRALKSKGTYQGITTDYRGVPVLGSYSWIPDLNAVMVGKIDLAEAFAPITRLRNWLVALVASSAAFVVLASFWLAGGLTPQVRHLMELFGQIGVGNFQARCTVSSRDELGTVAASLNSMLDGILPLMQSREERDRIQAAIVKLLDEISGLAEGDLTREAEVTADVTGAIADSFNYVIEQLRGIVSSVQDATLKVSSSASQIRATAEHLAQGSEAQATQILATSTAVDEVAASIHQVSDSANQSSQVADQALANARKGSEMVQNTIQGMSRIRDQVQETAKRIKRLGESTQQIGEIVQLIDDIADRTSILALNASIQASMAGEAGRGFAVVAEEVERLAERSTNATKKIANLVKAIQAETNEAVTAMEESTREVVQGSQLANQAGQALNEIGAVSNRLAELIQSITLAAKQQARASEGIAKAMSQISDVTQQTASGTKQAAESVNSLSTLADELRGSVGKFKLPGSNGHGDGASASGSDPTMALAKKQGGAAKANKEPNGHARGKHLVATLG
jgi:methyl-accepting chemotaxis protein